MLFYMHAPITHSVSEGWKPSLALPDFLIASVGFAMILAVQVSSVWLADSEKRWFRLLRAVFLLLAGIGLGKAAMDVTKLFQTLAISSGGDSDMFTWAFEETAPFFHIGAICLVISTACAALTMIRPTETIARSLTKMMETGAWVLALLLLIMACRHFARLDELFQGAAGKGVDPSDAAAAFTGALRGVLNWAGLLIVAGLLAIVGVFGGQREVERSSSSVSQ
jgi:hypothetical protein